MFGTVPPIMSATTLFAFVPLRYQISNRVYSAVPFAEAGDLLVAVSGCVVVLVVGWTLTQLLVELLYAALLAMLQSVTCFVAQSETPTPCSR